MIKRANPLPTHPSILRTVLALAICTNETAEMGRGAHHRSERPSSYWVRILHVHVVELGPMYMFECSSQSTTYMYVAGEG